MRQYLLRVFDGFGQQLSIFERGFSDDLSALEYARSLAGENAVEIWYRGFPIACVKVDVEPATVGASPAGAP